MAGTERRARRGGRSKTKLAALRRKKGISQKAMAKVTGISLATYRRLERGQIRLPPLAYYVNCAWALDCELSELLDKDLTSWTVLDARIPEPPQPDWWEVLRRDPRDLTNWGIKRPEPWQSEYEAEQGIRRL